MKNSLSAIVMVLICASCCAAQMSLGKDSLKGLIAVRVAVENPNSELADVGVSKDQLQQDVELRLRKAGIKVLSDDTSFTPFLHVTIGGFKMPNSRATAYAIKVDLHQYVVLARDGSVKLYAETWSANLTVGYAVNLTEIRNAVGDDVDTFINDYFSQNPR